MTDTLPPLATASDLADHLGLSSIPAARVNQAGQWLVIASSLVRRHTGREWLTSDGSIDESEPTIDADDLAIARGIVAQAVGRVWHNPGAAWNEATGPHSVSWGEQGTRGLHLSEIEKDQLDVYKTSSRPGLWVKTTTRDRLETTDTYVDVDGGEPIPIHPEPW